MTPVSWKVSLLLVATTLSYTIAFAPMASFVPRTSANRHGSLEASTETDYDVVKVDLADGRDYPIYIGAGFSDEEGENHISIQFFER